MAVKLHRCSLTMVKGPHPCWRAQKALDDAGVEYTVVKHPPLPRGRRKDYIALTGQKMLPAVELADGSVIREETTALVARIREGRLT